MRLWLPAGPRTARRVLSHLPAAETSRPRRGNCRKSTRALWVLRTALVSTPGSPGLRELCRSLGKRRRRGARLRRKLQAGRLVLRAQWTPRVRAMGLRVGGSSGAGEETSVRGGSRTGLRCRPGSCLPGRTDRCYDCVGRGPRGAGPQAPSLPQEHSPSTARCRPEMQVIPRHCPHTP